MKKEEKHSQYILLHRCLGLRLDPSVALGIFILKDDIQDDSPISLLRIAEFSTWRWVVRSSFISFYAIFAWGL